MSLTPAQVEARRHGVGCSEILAALGKDPRCSRLELYMRKVGELPEPDLSDDPRVHFGTVLEPVIRAEFARRIGRRVIVPRITRHHPTAPLLGHPDGWIPALNEGVEVKTADKFEAEEFGAPDSDQVPVRYLVQCAGYMAITRAKKWHLAVLIGGNDLRTYEIPRDDELEAAILAGVREFWSHVEQRRPPDPETPEDVKLRWPKDLGHAVVATPEIAMQCAELRELKTLIKEAERKEAALKAEIQKFMQEASELVDADGTVLATWRKTKDAAPVIDQARLAREAPDLYAKLLETYPATRHGSRRFLLK